MRPMTAGRERPHEDGDAERRADRQRQHAGPQEHREEAQHGGEHPDRRSGSADVDAERGGTVGPLGDAADGDTDLRRPQEPRQAAEQQRHDDEDHQVVVVEHDAADAGAHVERRVEGGHPGLAEAEPPGHEQRDAGEHLGDADGGDGEDQAGGAAEAVDEQPLRERPEQHRGHEADGEADDVGLAGDPVRWPAGDVGAMSRMAKTAGTTPRSPWAKLTMRLAR
jgi:hypothetical protein